MKLRYTPMRSEAGEPKVAIIEAVSKFNVGGLSSESQAVFSLARGLPPFSGDEPSDVD